MLQVTRVPLSSATRRWPTVAWLPPKQSALTMLRSAVLSMISWLPLPIETTSVQAIFAPMPAGVPLQMHFPPGSRSNHGEHWLKRGDESRVAKASAAGRSARHRFAHKKVFQGLPGKVVIATGACHGRELLLLRKERARARGWKPLPPSRSHELALMGRSYREAHKKNSLPAGHRGESSIALQVIGITYY